MMADDITREDLLTISVVDTVKIDLPIQYKFREDELIEEFKKYIDATYNQHYSKNGSQTMESIVNAGHGTGFCMGNVRKYSDRYGSKGETPDEWRKDLVKTMHYCLFQLFIHDSTYNQNE